MTSVDTMHNLYLGIVSTVFCSLVTEGYLTTARLKEIDELIQETVKTLPNSWFSRLPSGFTGHYKSFTADEWRNFFLYVYPSIAARMKNPLPGDVTGMRFLLF